MKNITEITIDIEDFQASGYFLKIKILIYFNIYLYVEDKTA